MKTIIAILTILGRGLCGFWEFFCRWFLPPPYPPDPLTDDEEAQTAVQVERQKRVGWAAGLVGSDLPIQDAVLSDDATRRPIYPTATNGRTDFPTASYDPYEDGEAAPLDEPFHGNPESDLEIAGGYHADSVYTGNDPTGNDNTEPLRPSDRPKFLEDHDSPEDEPHQDPMVAQLTRKPEGEPVARSPRKPAAE